MQLQFQQQVTLDGQAAYLGCMRVAEESMYTICDDVTESSSEEML
jgi:hypothetical protein